MTVPVAAPRLDRANQLVMSAIMAMLAAPEPTPVRV
jgi:hypothetical protein